GGNNTPFNAAPGQGQIADNIKYLMSDKLIRPPQAVLNNRTFADNERVLCVCAFAESLFTQRVGFALKAEGARGTDFFSESFWGPGKVQVLDRNLFGVVVKRVVDRESFARQRNDGVAA